MSDYRIAYGLEFPAEMNDLEIEVYCYMYDDRIPAEDESSHAVRRQQFKDKENVGHRLHRFNHFSNIVDLLWNWRESTRKVIWNPWTDEMLRNMVEHDVVSLAGCASSGKSDSAAVYAIVQFICAPTESLILITSTSIGGAQLRVWKSVSALWNALPKEQAPGQMVYSKCRIRGWDKNGEKSDDLGIMIVAAGSGSEDEAYEKLIGIKQERLYLIADELPQLPKNIVEAAFGNMVNGTNKEKQEFKMVAMGNPNLMTDAFGIMCEPLDGWNSVNESTMKWKTARGVVLRFDAEKNPNILCGETRYPWYPSSDAIKKAKLQFGAKSLMYYRQYKAFWFKGADTESVYSEAEIVTTHSNKPFDPERDGELQSFVNIAGADPAYTQGGDEFPFISGRVITTRSGKQIIEVLGADKLDDGINIDIPRSHHMVNQLKDLCSKKGIAPDHFAYDGTGAGIPFRDIIIAEWSSLPIDVRFGGKASTRRAGATDERIACDIYANRVTELWVRVKGLIREGRIRGLTDKIISEMCARRFDPTTRSGRGKLKVESKVVMKAREGNSPDWADAFFVLVEAAVRRGLISDMEVDNVSKRSLPCWEEAMMTHDICTHSGIHLT